MLTHKDQNEIPDLIPIQDLLDRQNTNRLLEGQTILGMIVQGHTQFQQWAIQILQKPDNIDLFAVWKKKLNIWKQTLSLMIYPINQIHDIKSLSKTQQIFYKWNQHIHLQISIADQLFTTILRNVSQNMLINNLTHDMRIAHHPGL